METRTTAIKRRLSFGQEDLIPVLKRLRCNSPSRQRDRHQYRDSIEGSDHERIVTECHFDSQQTQVDLENVDELLKMFLSEMSSASGIDDARTRASKMLHSLEKEVLGEQLKVHVHENSILKQAIIRQNKMEKDYAAMSQEEEELRKAIGEQEEKMRTLKAEINYKQMQIGKAGALRRAIPFFPGPFNPDVF
ncbi:hypothetical protein J5N97_002695 [Dioscorea zingiberensis]|uniref:Uncharacterized protein n=1 Tax=Dioscorea zingiberensis TaxID=325984 RepID=A0A9D5D4E3_9LILI|nr:hypothetical protein J5N97_002695 [Dioscorea zingiberensis]